MDRALHGIGGHDGAAALVGKRVYGVGCVVPQKVVRPAARLAQSVGIAAAKEIGLNVHLLDVEPALRNLFVHVLVAGVKAPGMAANRHQSGVFGKRYHALRVL